MAVDYRTRQKFEARMIEAGRQRALTNLNKALARDDAGVTPAGVALTRRMIEPMVVAFKAYVDAALQGKAGRRSIAATYLAHVDAEVACFITIRTAISATVRQRRYYALTRLVANNLDKEVRAARFEQANPGLYHAIINRARDNGVSDTRLFNSLSKAAREFHIDTQKLSREQEPAVGGALLDLMVGSLDIFRMTSVGSGYLLTFTDQINEWFEKYNEAALLSAPAYLPVPYQPTPWVSIYGGGYADIRSANLMNVLRGQHPAVLEAADLSIVFTGLNAIQDTPWEINKRVFAVMQDAWSNGQGTFPDVPTMFNPDLPNMPPEIEALPSAHPARREWRRTRFQEHLVNRSTNSERATFLRKIKSATELSAMECFYFPHKVDFRGRAYPFPDVLHPQGDDLAKSLLIFHNAKPLGETGVDWLAVHGANCWGNDKVSFADRRSWSFNNAAKIMSVARDPLADRWWTEADKPWQFLAWCFEFSAMLTNPGGWEDYASSLPVGLDGSCNGLQHFAAMLRDEPAAISVNLLPAETPRDVYQDVADLVMERLAVTAETTGTIGRIAGIWHAFGIDRKITKRSVMVVPYGGTSSANKEYVAAAVMEKIEKLGHDPFGDELPTALQYLYSVVWDAIGTIIKSARDVMTWLRDMAGVWVRAGQPPKWTTPSGFVAMQHYYTTQERRIKTRFQGALLKLKDHKKTDALSSADNRRGLPPNFVHSLDAAAMFLTVAACRAKGITSFMMIHDSYGTHAADVQTMADTLRDVFVDMYENHDPLVDFYNATCALVGPDEAAKVPLPPARGNLDLQKVKDSLYFFA